MNLEFLKSTKGKIIFGVLAAFIVIIIVVAISYGNGRRSSDKAELICTMDKEMQDTLKTNQTYTLYKTDEGIRMLLNTKLSILGQLTDYSSSIYNLVVRNLEEEYSYLDELNYVDYDIEYNDDYVIFNIEYKITDESNNQIIAEYNYDFLNNSSEDIKKYFEEGGYKCQES